MNLFSLSFGKDSMATLILAAEQGIPIDRVMYVDVKFNDEISGEHPLMAEWIPTAERRLHELFGVTVDHAYSGVSFYEQFYKVYKRGSRTGEIYAFPLIYGAWCNSMLKIKPINAYTRQFDNITYFVGIASDEPVRWERMLKKQTEKVKYRSLLVEQNITENDCYEICRKYGLLSPIYNISGISRGGCWFCPKQSYANLYHLYTYYPERYKLLSRMEKDSPRTMNSHCSLEELAQVLIADISRKELRAYERDIA